MYKLTRKGDPQVNYTFTEADGQLAFSTSRSAWLMIPSGLDYFNNSTTSVSKTRNGEEVYCMEGTLDLVPGDDICPVCGRKMHINNTKETVLTHLTIGSTYSCVKFQQKQYYCPDCGFSRMQTIPFKASGHRITVPLYRYTRDLLSRGTYTLKQVAELTGLGRNTVKDIDRERLQELYTTDGTTLIQPEEPAKFIGIDEFKLHDNYRYATHIIDMQTGHVLWIEAGKKKQIVYDFIDHVGMEWMSHVEAVACDMNSDFYEAFYERCPHVCPVFDHFHVIKNFNDKVVSEVRKDEQRRLKEAGDEEGYKSLKGSRYILTSSRATLQKKDQEAKDGKVISKGSAILGTEDYVRNAGYESRYDELLKQNKLLFTCDLIKEKLDRAYRMTDETKMGDAIAEIVYLCNETGNEHFKWFARLLYRHHDGVVAHAKWWITSGKIEGINNKIKTIRRMGYGYPDDDYFFLKVFDISRQKYVRNPKSHRKSD